MHDETTLFYFIEKLYLLCFEMFSHLQNINETYYRHYLFVKLFLLENWMILTRLQLYSRKLSQNYCKSSIDGF